MRLILSIFFFGGVLIACAESDNPDSKSAELKNPELGTAQPLEMHCDEGQKRCTAALPRSLADVGQQQTLVLKLQSPDLPALKPLKFELASIGASTVSGLDESALLRAWIEGRDMFMGEHQLEFGYDSARETFTLDGMIPVCVTGSEMVWRLSVELNINHSKVLVYADLRSLNHS